MLAAMRACVSILIIAVSAAPAFAGSAEVCVENGTDDPWVFVAHADDGARNYMMLGAGDLLCSEGAGDGTVAVFAEENDVEGCSRRVPAGTTERLVSFPGVDLCDWERR